MFGDSALQAILAKTFSKKKNQQDDQRITMLGSKKRTKHSREEMGKFIDPVADKSDEAREIVPKRHGSSNRPREATSSKEEALSPSREVGDAREDDDEIMVRTRLRVLRVLNDKLMIELADTKVSAERYLADYEKERNAHEKERNLREKERNARRMAEDICTEMKTKLAISVKNFETLKLEAERMKVAMQIRENALEMKLEDARLIVEKKYEELDYLQNQLEVFVRKNSGNRAPKMEDIAEAENLLEEVYMARQRGM